LEEAVFSPPVRVSFPPVEEVYRFTASPWRTLKVEPSPPVTMSFPPVEEVIAAPASP
jgi:hypothetical protein